MKNTIARIAFSTIVMVTTTTTHAGPPKLDVLGLVAGVSTKADVNKTASGFLTFGDLTGVYLEIGGHRILCAAIFRDNKLDGLACPTGENRKDPFKTKASNIRIYNDLKAGFTKKFGPPDSVEDEPVRNTLGVEFANEGVIWVDARGGALLLGARHGKIDEGMISLMSPEVMKNEQEKKKAEEAKKKF
jgi:hypothetical protein